MTIHIVDIEAVDCPTKEKKQPMMDTLKNFKSWQIEKLILSASENGIFF